MSIYYYCSDGARVTQATIDKNLSRAYRDRYEGEPHPRCEETGVAAECSSHIISQKRCKELHMTELIWNPINFFPATHNVNSRWESNDTTLRNYNEYMDVVRKFDPIGYEKRLNL